MAVEITMPKLGLTMEEGTVIDWLVKEGQPIEAGKPLMTVETDKVNIDVEAPASGILLKILVDEGNSVPIGTIIGYIGESGEKIPEIVEKPEQPESSAPTAFRAVDRQAQATQRESGQPVSISPIAKKLAVEYKIAYEHIHGTGPGGRIVEEDIRKAIEDDQNTQTETPYVLEKLTNIKRITGQRMSESFQHVPHFYLRRQINMERMAAI